MLDGFVSHIAARLHARGSKRVCLEDRDVVKRPQIAQPREDRDSPMHWSAPQCRHKNPQRTQRLRDQQKAGNQCRLCTTNKKTGNECRFFRYMVRPERFELPTPKFVAWCSIQLSYGRMLRDILCSGVAEAELCQS
jgi:hypothetical protein